MFDRALEQQLADASATLARMHDELARDAAGIVAAVGDGVGVAGERAVLEGEHSDRQVIAALKPQKLVLANRIVAVSIRGGIKQLRKLFQMLAFELRDDFDVVHRFGGVSAGPARRMIVLHIHSICNWLR